MGCKNIPNSLGESCIWRDSHAFFISIYLEPDCRLFGRVHPFKAMGKTAVAAMTSFDLLVVLVLGTAITEPIVTKRLGIASYYSVAIAMIYLVFSRLSIANRFKKILRSSPTVLIRNGDIDEKGLRKVRVSVNELLGELRINGYSNVQDVEMATMNDKTLGKNEISRYNPYTTHKELGPIGDWLGGSSTPLFTLASFLVLVAALMAQMAELRATREEFTKQNEESRVQNKLLSIQRFENTFFQMVSLHHQIVNSIEDIEEVRDHGIGIYPQGNTNSTAVIIRGRTVLSNWCRDYGISSTRVNRSYDQLMENFNNLYNDKESTLGHYFRNLYHIVHFINSSSELIIYNESNKKDEQKTLEERRKYIRIIRAQLSTRELLLLFYNALTDNGRAFYDLIVEYRLLNNLRLEVIPSTLHDEFSRMNQH